VCDAISQQAAPGCTVFSVDCQGADIAADPDRCEPTRAKHILAAASQLQHSLPGQGAAIAQPQAAQFARTQQPVDHVAVLGGGHWVLTQPELYADGAAAHAAVLDCLKGRLCEG
jgi:hypothetical protein